MDYDWQTMKHPTLPLRVGGAMTRIIAVAVLFVFEALVLLQNGWSPTGIALSLSFIYTAAILLYTNPKQSEYYYTLGIDSTMLVQFLLVCGAAMLGPH